MICGKEWWVMSFVRRLGVFLALVSFCILGCEQQVAQDERVTAKNEPAEFRIKR
jgi:hypothetical protein